MPASVEITQLTHRWSEGDPKPLDEVSPILYERLRVLAYQRVQAAPAEHSPNTTGLLHEACIVRLACHTRVCAIAAIS